ncbi:hypothetical protein C5Q97_16155 [Victivallales bacterium CCUG 44730]|nr:hypothetical protein C5Q97_16155 [Victivallales bacterium CCUG 44730]
MWATQPRFPFFCGENRAKSVILWRNTTQSSAWLNSCSMTPGAVLQMQNRAPNTSAALRRKRPVMSCSTVPAASGGRTPAASRSSAESPAFAIASPISDIGKTGRGRGERVRSDRHPHPRKMKKTAPAMQIAA